MNLTYCENCNDMVEFTIHSAIKRNVINGGVGINYRGKEARCIECRKEVFVHAVRDHNLKQLEKKYS